MLALLPFGLLEVLLVLLAATLVIGVVVSFGYPAAADFRSLCPACHADALQCVEAGVTAHRHRLRVFRCEHCGAAFSESLDGTLVAMPTEL